MTDFMRTVRFRAEPREYRLIIHTTQLTRVRPTQDTYCADGEKICRQRYPKPEDDRCRTCGAPDDGIFCPADGTPVECGRGRYLDE